MKRFILIFFILTLTLSLNALGTLRVESIKELPVTHKQLSVYGADGKFAPVLIIKSELKGLGFQNIGRPTKHAPIYNKNKNEYKFYMNDNQRVVEITHSDYVPLEVLLLDDYGVNVDAQRVYEIILTNVPEKEFINIVIISDPPGAEKIIDNKNFGTGQSFELFIGSHSLKLQKNGYKSITREIEVSKSNTLFNNLNLQEVEPIIITIKSTPLGASIFIDDVVIGETNYQPFLFPGKYNLRLSLSKYETIEKMITVTEVGSNIFSYNLEKQTAILKVKTIPENVDVYINNEKLNGESKEVSAGKYRIEVSKGGYFKDSRTIDVLKGKNVTEMFTLKQKTGKLLFSVQPMEAQIVLKKNDNTIQNWSGSNSLSNLSIGDYTISITCNGYKNKSREVTINVEETTKLNIILERSNIKSKIAKKPKSELENRIKEEEQIDSTPNSKILNNSERNINWNDTDSRLVAEQMIKDLMYRPWLQDFILLENSKPILCVGVINSNSLDNQQVDGFIKALERELINSGKVKFSITERNNADNYKLCGADFVIKGVIKSNIDQAGNRKAIFFQIDLELVDIKLNKKIWIGSKEIRKTLVNREYKW